MFVIIKIYVSIFSFYYNIGKPVSVMQLLDYLEQYTQLRYQFNDLGEWFSCSAFMTVSSYSIVITLEVSTTLPLNY